MSDSVAIGNVVKHVKYPILLKNICNWSILKWSIEDWIENMSKDLLPFRSSPSSNARGSPCWERQCPIKTMTMEDFVKRSFENNNEWLYFDYKYMTQWFKTDSVLYKEIQWDSFGFPNRDASESTIWIGSKGAHTPCHQDTYGFNIVVQVHGRKQWILLPPETEGMKPSRIPYEESSVYSQLNFNSPTDLKPFEGLCGYRIITLEPGEALVVPPKWWHYVENVSPIAISINTWVAVEDLDAESRIEEALTRFLVAQICKDLPESQLPSILNPNEDDLPEMPLTIALNQLDSAITHYKQHSSSTRELKSGTTEQFNTPHGIKFADLDSFIDSHSNIFKIEVSPKDQLMTILCKNVDNNGNTCQETPYDSEKNSKLTRALINSVCSPSVIKMAKECLLYNYN